MKTFYKTGPEIAVDASLAPRFLEGVLSTVGLPLSSLRFVEWTEQDDGQLVRVGLHFIPSPGEP